MKDQHKSNLQNKTKIEADDEAKVIIRKNIKSERNARKKLLKLMLELKRKIEASMKSIAETRKTTKIKTEKTMQGKTIRERFM